MRLPQQRARDREPLLLAARDFYSTLTDHRVEAFVGPRQEGVSSSLVQDIKALRIGRVRIDELEIFPTRTREELSVLSHEPDPLPQSIEIHGIAGHSVVQDASCFRRIETHEQLHQRRLPRSRRTYECDGFTALHVERYVGESRRRRSLVNEPYVLELQILDLRQWNWSGGSWILRRLEKLSEVDQRDFCLPKHVDDVAELLHWAKDEKRVEQEREELADRDLLGEDQVKHHEENRSAQEINGRSLYEAQASDVLHFLELEIEDLLGSRVQPHHFLIGESETLHQLDVPQ